MSEDQDVEVQLQRIRFNFVRSNHYRVIHCSSVVLGFTPQQTMYLDIIAEKIEADHSIVRVLNPDGSVGDEIEGSGDESEALVTREIEASVFLSQDAARSLTRMLASTLGIDINQEPQTEDINE